MAALESGTTALIHQKRRDSIPPVMVQKKKKNDASQLLRKPRVPVQSQQTQAKNTVPAVQPNVLDSDQLLFGDFRCAPESDYITSMPTNVVSPPPPSELQSIVTDGSHFILTSNLSQPARTDLQYILDPVVRNKTNLGTYVEGCNLVKPDKRKGPDSFPARLPKQLLPIPASLLFYEYFQESCQLPLFTLEDFLISFSECQNVSLLQTKQLVYSRHNYIKLQNMIIEKLQRKQESLHKIELTPSASMPDVSSRIPQKQLLIEMAALVREQMSEVLGSKMKSLIRPLPKYSPNYKNTAAIPHTEIVLYEDKKPVSGQKRFDAREAIMHSGQTKCFQDSRRCASPFTMAAENQVSPSEVAVLDSLMNGGVALSLKAHFIEELPDIKPIAKTLTYINLSFNNIKVFPSEILNITQLTVLKLRNNPLKELPLEISALKNLRCLILSYCLISQLPLSVFLLEKLEYLDVAYNYIKYLPNEIGFLGILRSLNLEGNQLTAMPFGSLKLYSLKNLKVRNNFMHPMFWKENSTNSPQKLLDQATLFLKKSGLQFHYKKLPEIVEIILNSTTTCDCCHGPLYGPGLRIIRPVSKMYEIKNLPFLFTSCSPYCQNIFQRSSESLSSILYGKN